MTDIGFFYIIVCEFNYQKTLNLVILPIIIKGLEVSSYSTVFPLSMAIGLWLEGS